MLSPNQITLLRAVEREPRTTAELARLHKDDGGEFGEDAARNAMSRLENRHLVVGSGPGSARRWSATPAGLEELRVQGAAAPAEPPSNGDAPDEGAKERGYVVLEETNLGRALRDAIAEMGRDPDALDKDLLVALESRPVYEIVYEPEARNTEHALRQAAKAVYEDGGQAVLIPVSKRHWQPERVTLNTSYSVSIG